MNKLKRDIIISIIVVVLFGVGASWIQNKDYRESMMLFEEQASLLGINDIYWVKGNQQNQVNQDVLVYQVDTAVTGQELLDKKLSDGEWFMRESALRQNESDALDIQNITYEYFNGEKAYHLESLLGKLHQLGYTVAEKRNTVWVEKLTFRNLNPVKRPIGIAYGGKYNFYKSITVYWIFAIILTATRIGGLRLAEKRKQAKVGR